MHKGLCRNKQLEPRKQPPILQPRLIADTPPSQPDCPVCHVGLSIDLEGEAVDLEEGGKKKGKQGILGRLDLDVRSCFSPLHQGSSYELIPLVTLRRIGGRRPSLRLLSRS